MLIGLGKLMGLKDLEGRDPAEVRTVFFLLLTSVFFIADTQLIAPNVNVIKLEFGKVDEQIGLISTIFIFSGAIIALLWGYFADRYQRKRLVLATIVLGEIPCLLTGYVESYEQLLVMRALTGLGIGGIMPLTFSMVGDLVSDRERPAAAAWLGLAEGMGIAGGMLMAGHLGDSSVELLGASGWRLPFVLAALPNFMLAPVFLLVCKEPTRGGAERSIQAQMAEGREYTRRIQLKDYKVIFANRTNLYYLLQGVPGTIGWGVFLFWMVTFFIEDKNMSKALAPNPSILVRGCLLVGAFGGGLVGNYLHAKSPRWLPIFCGVTTLVGMALFLVMFAVPLPADPSGGQLALTIGVGMVAGLFIAITGPNVKAIVLNVNPPENRGAMMSVITLADSIGKGVGPLLGGIMIGLVGYSTTMNLATSAWLLCALVFLFLMTAQYPKDAAALERLMQERAREMEEE